MTETFSLREQFSDPVFLLKRLCGLAAKARKTSPPWCRLPPLAQMVNKEGAPGPVAENIVRHVANLFRAGRYSLSRGKPFAKARYWLPDTPLRIPLEEVDLEDQDHFYRPILALSVKDLLVHSVVADALRGVIEPKLPPSVVGFRKGKDFGIGGALQHIRRWREEGYNWFLRLDVKRYENSVDHEMLTRNLNRLLASHLSSNDLETVMSIVASYLERSASELKQKSRGFRFGGGGWSSLIRHTDKPHCSCAVQIVRRLYAATALTLAVRRLLHNGN